MNGDRRTVSERLTDEEDLGDETRLDGNAAAGMLNDLFVPDVTSARTTCANCEAVSALGALLVYGYAMGMVMRCPNCDAVVMRVARMRAHICLDPTGAKLLVVAASSGARSAA
jgi:hypothetical protein